MPETTSTTIETRRVLHEAGAVMHVAVSNPRRLNVLDSAAIAGLRDALRDAAADAATRVIVMEGAGDKAWIGGADIREMSSLDPRGARAFIEGLHALCDEVRGLRVPVVASIRGWCLGAGLEVAACCDLRLAGASSRYGMPEVRVGIPSVIEAALLPRLIGAGRVRDLVMTGRVVEAREAFAWGLLDGMVADDALEALVARRVGELLEAAPGALAAQKRLCRQWEELPLAEAVSAGIDAFAQAYRGEEPAERMRRFLDRPR